MHVSPYIIIDTIQRNAGIGHSIAGDAETRNFAKRGENFVSWLILSANKIFKSKK